MRPAVVVTGFLGWACLFAIGYAQDSPTLIGVAIGVLAMWCLFVFTVLNPSWRVG